jgi:alpha-L-rhamnosidase
MKEKTRRDRCAAFVAISIAFAAAMVSHPTSLAAKPAHNSTEAESVTATRLTCEYRTNPVAVAAARPRLSWQIDSDIRDVVQLAYRVIVSSSPERLARNDGDLWDSKEVSSNNTLNIVYSGRPLSSRMTCYWKVEVWTNKSGAIWSDPASWTMALLKRSDWKAEWIGLDSLFAGENDDSVHSRLAARYFRKEFNLKDRVEKATLYISGLGLYELYINGKRVGTQVLSPTLSDYTKRIYYNTFDVTTLLTPGEDAIGVILGNGRFFSMRPIGGWVPVITNYGFPKMIMQLEIEMADGSRKIVTSDGSWKVTANGPIRANNEYDGEEYDARMEMPGWSAPGFDDSHWMKVQVVKPSCDILEAQPNPNIEVMDTVRPISIFEPRPGTYIVDMGQNMVGWVQMTAKGKRGTAMKLRFAERLNDAGDSLYTANLRQAEQTDNYIFKGTGEETWEPSFVYHGFRYVEITGLTYRPEISSILGKVVYDKMETTGSFESSNPLLNRIYKAAYWGIRGNYRGIPTDCPQRDERMGWLGDRSTNSYGESFIFGNNLLYSKWLTDIQDSQKPDGSVPDVAPAYWVFYTDNMTWPSTFLLVPDHLYRQFGNERAIADHYAAMRKWLFYMRDKYMKNYLLPKDTYGDWCMPPERMELIHSEDTTRITPGPFIGSAYFYYCLNVLRRDALLLGKTKDASEFASLASKVRDAINETYLNEKSHYYANNTVTANLLALRFGIVPDSIRSLVFDNIVEVTVDKFHSHISTGLVGGQWLMRTLTDYGRADLAYTIATNSTYPGWGYMIENGATTIWELWNGNKADPAMNSGNHVMLLGDLVVWLYEDVAGIESSRAKPAYQEIVMYPREIDSLKYVDASYNSVRGLVRSDWKKENGKFLWNITVPANSSAIVYVPASDRENVMEGGRRAVESPGVEFLRMENHRAVFRVSSGSYKFISVTGE